ncbi:MAG: peptidase C14 [Chitinophagaceae bacterium]|nr:MAG: peptidase C14 [Chitinophagaceae bacterium]
MKNCLLLIVGLLAVLTPFAQTTQPILRLETGMHAAMGNRISTDAAGKYLLTTSDDKTARLWDAATGRQLQIFRVPTEGTNEGKLYCGALSPNGKLAAVGGRTGYEWEDYFCVYLIETQTGRIMHRVTGVPGAPLDIEFSADGAWMGIGLNDKKGVAVVRTDNWSVKVLSGYEGDVYNVAFDQKGRLATVCEDAKIRLYSAERFELLATETCADGGEPFSIAFNPSGTLLAVGYNNLPDVDVRSGSNLRVLYKPELGEASTRSKRIGKVCFSADGTRLYAGSHFGFRDITDGKWRYAIRYWNDEGKGTYRDVVLCNNSIMDLKPMPNGGVAIVSSHPDLGVIDKDHSVAWYVNSNTNDFAGTDDNAFRVNRDGSAIGFQPYKEPSISFEIQGRRLEERESPEEPAIASAGGTTVDKGSVEQRVKINGKTVDFMGGYERCGGVDVTSDGRYVLVGGSWNLYCADARGQKIWRTPLPGNCKSVNISGNDKLALAQLDDGTIRWYNMTDGKELLAYFLHNDKTRWVIFTPSGYYDASVGAEDLLGWHINKGKDATPAFFPVSRFRETYYRPDIIDAIFETFNEERAVTLANSRNNRTQTSGTGTSRGMAEKLPPTITILSPAGGSTVRTQTVRVEYSLSTPEDAPVKNVKVLVNGRPVALERGIQKNPSNKYGVNVSIPSGDCTVTIMAENEHGMSPEANVFLHYAAAADRGADEFVRKPKLYVLAVGISNYTNPEYKLNYADKDANAFVSGVSAQKGKLYGDVVVRKYLNADATRENIQDGLQWIQEQTGQGDMAMIFYAGHGMNDNNGTFYMLPVAADVNRLRSTCLNFEELRQTVSSIAGKVVVFIDACHSGNVMGSSQRRGGTDINAIVNELSSTQNGAITFTSSTGKEYSLEDPSWEHGAFTMALLEGLSGKAAIPGKTKITIKSLDAYISERVKELTKGKQHPTSVVPPNVPDFTIGVH